MVVEELQIVIDDVWMGLYGESWKGLICDEAFAHPAKFSRALIRKIYDHVIEEGWATKGNSVVDPFGGVALGAFDAMRHGLNWYGCELESKFVGLGSQNIALWNERFSRMPNWGSARLLQGDSRKLATVLSAGDCCVSSPPYAGSCAHTGGDDPKPEHLTGGAFYGVGISSPPYSESMNRAGGIDGEKSDHVGGPHSQMNRSDTRYGSSDGQLGAMKEGDHSLVVSSPPYARSLMPDMNDPEKYAASEARYRDAHPEHKRPKGAAMVYGNTKGNLGHMPEGTVDAAITSPPYNPPMSQDHNGTRGGSRGTTPSERGAFVKYGNSEGQLEGMSMDGHDIAITSPPYADAIRRERPQGDNQIMREKTIRANYGQSEGQLERMPMDGFSAAISSPPYEAQDVNLFCTKNQGKRFDQLTDAEKQERKDATMGNYGYRNYAAMTDGQLSAERGETFWSASRLILEQLHQVIVPGGHAVFVVKAFVRDKKIVDFPAQWAQLCEAVGFRLLHHHRASLVEHSGTQRGFEQDKQITVERKSFFRRLAEKKGSPRIDHESVLCFERLA